MKNPFVYGEAVRGEHFTDRKSELQTIVRGLLGGERIFLISPRRYGKTSLILRALDELKSHGFYTVYIDLYKVTSLQNFVEIYAREVARSVETKLEKAFNFLKKNLPGLRPKITIQPDGAATLGIDYLPRTDEAFQFLNEIYDLPQQLADKKQKRFIMVFDEFQEVRNLNGDSLEKAMRASYQHHDKVSYLFAGSKRHVLYDMISNPEAAFYKMGRIFNLTKIPRNEFSNYLWQCFQNTEYTVAKGTVELILDIVEDYPYNAQYLCHKLWEEFRDIKKIEESDIKPTLIQILKENSPIYISIWDGLSLHQRRLLKAIASYPGSSLFSQGFIDANNLGSSSSIQTSLKLLMKRLVLDKEKNTYFITDVFFKEWIRVTMC